jgi:hypothetical protein
LKIIFLPFVINTINIKNMKFFNNKCLSAIMVIAFFLTAFSAQAQDDKSKRASPPAEASEKVGDTQVTIEYSQTSAKGREIFGGLVPYNEIWRTGANEATTFEVENDVLIEGQPLPAGKYALFTIPGENEWTLIFNKEAEQWGAYEYDQREDALRVSVEPTEVPQEVEKLTFDIDENGEVSMAWADTKIEFQVEEQ